MKCSGLNCKAPVPIDIQINVYQKKWFKLGRKMETYVNTMLDSLPLLLFLCVYEKLN